MFISFEGGEGAGKSTLIEKMYHYLKEQHPHVVLTRAPGGTAIGDMIRNLLLHSSDKKMCSRAELFLFLSDRAQHVEEIILPALSRNQIVLCDRFNDSTLAYQGGARGFDLAEISWMAQFAAQHVQPDLTLYLDIDPEIGLSRVKRAKDRIEKEDLVFHQKIRSTYLEIAQKEPHRFYVLDASQPPDKVFYEAVQLLTSHWK